MALSATFTANFASFYDAVDKADAKLKDFGTGADKVSGRLNTLANQFSGQKIVQEATIMAKAVETIGGVAKLTDAELRRVGATATEAAEKMTRLGQTVPPGIQKIADAAKAAADKTKALADEVKHAGEQTGFFETKAIAMGTALGSFAGGLATQAMQKLGQEVGVFIERGAKLPAIEGSFKRLAEGVKLNADQMVASMQVGTSHLVADFDLMQSANKAMLLGLPVTEQGMGDLAKTATILGRAMGQDATKSLDDLITALGRSSPMILDNLGLTVKVGEANEAYARKLGLAVDQLNPAQQKMAFYEAAMEAARKKTAELGEQSLTLGEIVVSVWTRIGNAVTRQASEMNIGLGRAMSSWKEFGDFLQVAAAQGVNAAIKFEAERTRVATEAATAEHARTQAALDDLNKLEAARQGAGASMVEQLKIAREHVAALTTEQRANVAAMVTLGKQYADLPKDIKLTAAEFDLLKAQLQAAATASRAAESEAKKHQEALEALAAAQRPMSDATYDVIVALAKQGQSEADIAKAIGVHAVQVRQVMDAEKVAAENAKILTAERLKDAAAVQKIMDEAIKRADALAKVVVGNLAIETKARRESADLQAKLSLSAYEYEKYQIRQWGEDQKRAVDTTAANWERAYAAIDQAVHDKLIAIVSHQQGVVRVTSDWSEQLKILSSEFQKLGSASGGTLGAVLGGIGQMVVQLEAADQATKQVGENNQELGGKFGAVSVLFNKNATDAQRWGAAVQTSAALASGAMDVWTASANQGSQAMNALAGAAAGAKAGSAFGVYGMMIGAAAGGTVGFVRSLDDGREALEQFANRSGGWDRLHAQMQALGAEGERMWVQLTQGIKKGDLAGATREILVVQQALSDLAAKAKWDFDQAAKAAEKAFQDAADAAKAAADEQLQVQEELRAAIKEYGFTIEELGPKWRQQELDIQAVKLLRTYDLLVASGIDVAIVQGRMSESILEYFHNAIKTGSTIPEAWRPILESMAAAGKLTDEAGNKLTDLSGVQWSKSLGGQLDTIAEKLQKILNHLLGIGESLDYVGSGAFKIPNLDFTGPAPPTMGGGFLPPSEGAYKMESYQGGTDGYKNFGAGTPVMLHGWEAVVPREQSSGAFATVSGGPVGGGVGTINVGGITLAPATVDEAWLRRGGARQIADAVATHLGRTLGVAPV